jgi:hypothetical protein
MSESKIWSLQLPSNDDGNGLFRWRKKGYKRLGFLYGAMVVQHSDGTFVGATAAPTPDEITTIAGTPATITTRVNYVTHTSTVTAYLPLVAGPLREVSVVKNGANGVTVTINPSDTGNIILSAAAAAGTTSTVATATSAKFVSDGVFWYRTQ